MTDADRLALVADTKRAEGWRAKAYQDSVGVWTIGFGRNVQAMTISRELGEAWLQEDLATAEAECRRGFQWFDALSSKRQAVLVEMSYNLGLPRLRGFGRMLAAAARGDHETAAREMLASRWADQVGARARRLADTWRQG